MNDQIRYSNMKPTKEQWLGAIPTSWGVLRLKRIFSIKKDVAGEEGHTVLSVTQKGIRPKVMTEKGQFAQDYSKYQLVNQGEFVMNHMDLLTGWVDISPYDGVTSPDYRVCVNTAPEKYDSGYYRYIFQLCYSARIFYGLGQGVAGFGRWRLPADMFLNFVLPVPPVEEQRRIAAYLDDQISQIDTIIEDVKGSIEEYKQWKDSIIFEGVTKGVAPNIEFKDSNVEWIGNVPKGWKITTLKHLCSMQAGKNLTSEQILDEGMFPVYGGNGIRGYYNSYNNDGDYVLVGRQGALCGNAHLVHGKFWATEHAVVTTCKDNTNVDYLYYLLIGMNLNQYASNAAAQPGLSVGTILNVKTVLPPMVEQISIAALLKERCKSIDELIEEKETLISDLELYKRSLIYEAVTGKRKVV